MKTAGPGGAHIPPLPPFSRCIHAASGGAQSVSLLQMLSPPDLLPYNRTQPSMISDSEGTRGGRIYVAGQAHGGANDRRLEAAARERQMT